MNVIVFWDRYGMCEQKHMIPEWYQNMISNLSEEYPDYSEGKIHSKGQVLKALSPYLESDES